MRGVVVRTSVVAATVLALVSVPAELSSAAAGSAVLAFQPAPYDFGQVSVGEGPERALELVNIGGRGPVR